MRCFRNFNFLEYMMCRACGEGSIYTICKSRSCSRKQKCLSFIKYKASVANRKIKSLELLQSAQSHRNPRAWTTTQSGGNKRRKAVPEPGTGQALMCREDQRRWRISKCTRTQEQAWRRNHNARWGEIAKISFSAPNHLPICACTCRQPTTPNAEITGETHTNGRGGGEGEKEKKRTDSLLFGSARHKDRHPLE